MRIIVKKFGGTSVSDISKMKRAASHIKKSLDKGFKVAVVVSAMGKETDRLMSLSKDLAHYDKTDDLSALLSSGELVSSSLMAITLNRLNIKSKSYQGWQIPIFTDENSSNARIIDINIKLLKIILLLLIKIK